MTSVNPIRSVDGVNVLCPASYTYQLSDISASNAGRTEDTNMDKMRVGQAVHLSLQWNALSLAEAASVLRAFNPEYIIVTYLDTLDGDFRTSEFYVGDRAAPMYNAAVGLWENVSFNIIERKGVER